MADNPLAPVHPGEILREEFLRPLGVPLGDLAACCRSLNVDIASLAREQAPVTADAARHLANYFGTSPEFWLDIQSRYDRESARRGGAV